MTVTLAFEGLSFEDYIVKQHPTGSNYICNPPVTNTDIDIVVLAKNGWEMPALSAGYGFEESDVEYESMGEFVSVRRGNENLIVTLDKKFYKKFVYATQLARLLNLTEKSDRVKLFQAVLYNTWNM